MLAQCRRDIFKHTSQIRQHVVVLIPTTESAAPSYSTLPYSTFSTYTRIVPPHDSPTFQAVSSATPNSSVLGLPLSITSSASVTTAPSTQPPEDRKSTRLNSSHVAI